MPRPKALLIDFGGVLTTSVIESFRAFGEGEGVDPQLVEGLLRDDAESSKALVDHEEGNASLADFERIFAARLSAHGDPVAPEGLVSRLTAGIRPDHRMIEAVRAISESGAPTAIVSNSLGYDVYDSYDLEAIADEVLISGRVGVRKPSRRMYMAACEAIDVPPEECLMVDDFQWNLDAAERLGMKTHLHHDTEDSLAVLGEMFDIPLSARVDEALR